MPTTTNDSNYQRLQLPRLQLLTSTPTSDHTYHNYLSVQPTASNTLPSTPATAYNYYANDYRPNQLQMDSTTIPLINKQLQLPTHATTTTTTTTATITTTTHECNSYQQLKAWTATTTHKNHNNYKPSNYNHQRLQLHRATKPTINDDYSSLNYGRQQRLQPLTAPTTTTATASSSHNRYNHHSDHNNTSNNGKHQRLRQLTTTTTTTTTTTPTTATA